MCQINAEESNVLWLDCLEKWGNPKVGKIRFEPHMEFLLYEENSTAIVCCYGPQYNDSPGYETGGRMHSLFVKLRFIR